VCSDGGGRTGVYIAVDALLEQLAHRRSRVHREQLAHGRHVDVFSLVVYLRSCRQNLVRTLVRGYGHAGLTVYRRGRGGRWLDTATAVA